MTMKKLISQVTVSLLVSGAVMTALAGGPDVPTMVTPGLYLGLGGSWNTVDMVASGLNQYQTNTNGYVTGYATDNFKDTQNRLAPMAQLGYWAPIDDVWLWGLVGEYKYLNYNTTNANTGFTGSSNAANNVLAASVDNLYTNLQHEFMLLLYFGAQYDKGYFYLGLGPVLFTLRNSVQRGGPGTAAGTGNPVQYQQSVSASDTIWGGAAQLGYNYYFNPTWFLGFNYTYTVTGDSTYTNTVNAGTFSSVVASATNTLNISRTLGFTVQEVMFSINKVFEL